MSSVGPVYLADPEAEVWLGFGDGQTAPIYFGCAYKRHTRYVLGTGPRHPVVGRETLASTRPIQLAGRMVAYETFYETPGSA